MTIAVELLLYYVFLLQRFTMRDSLTGLLNRQVYYFDMNTGANRISYAVSIDLNEVRTGKRNGKGSKKF